VSYSELFEVLRRAIKLRSSEETERNPISSRSHAVCVVKLLSSSSSSSHKSVSLSPGDSSKSSIAGTKSSSIVSEGGKLTFVDLAGSERNYETIKMTAAQHRESADINFSLMALKDCFRAYYAQMNGLKMIHRMTRVESQTRSHLSTLTYQPRCKNPANDLTPARAPYRASLLTRVLRECFVNCNSSGSNSNSTRVGNERDNERDLVSGKVTSTSTRSESSSSFTDNGDGSGAGTDEDMMESLQAVAALTDNRHYTTIITTVGPTPTDVQHTINSLDHVMLMSPKLHPLVTSITVEVPLKGLALSHLPIETWTTEQVNAWLASACGGRFAQLVLPPGLDGAGLMNLNMVSLSALCEGQLRTARQDGEGTAWVVNAAAAEENRHNYLGRALWAALRMQQQQQRIAAQEVKP
jgi:Kinesin motor domain